MVSTHACIVNSSCLLTGELHDHRAAMPVDAGGFVNV